MPRATKAELASDIVTIRGGTDADAAALVKAHQRDELVALLEEELAKPVVEAPAKARRMPRRIKQRIAGIAAVIVVIVLVAVLL